MLLFLAYIRRPTALARDPQILILPILHLLCLWKRDAREQLVLLLDNLCKECPEFAPLVNIVSDCLSLDCIRRITAPTLHEKFSVLRQCLTVLKLFVYNKYVEAVHKEYTCSY